jgi:ubiquinone/menaquinone biosynthesis C-methylase UbiE
MSVWWRLVRFGFRLLYNELAWTYDLVANVVSLGQWWSWQRTALPRLAGKRVLELAHGTGHFQVDLAAGGFTPVGVDLSPAMGRLARARLRRQGTAWPLVRADVRRLPFRAGAFDSIASTFPAEFIVDPATLAEAARMLPRGGRFVCVPNAILRGLNPLVRFLEWLYRVTGQRVNVMELRGQIAARIAGAGFASRVETVQLPRSTVTVVVLEKT